MKRISNPFPNSIDTFRYQLKRRGNGKGFLHIAVSMNDYITVTALSAAVTMLKIALVRRYRSPLVYIFFKSLVDLLSLWVWWTLHLGGGQRIQWVLLWLYSIYIRRIMWIEVISLFSYTFFNSLDFGLVEPTCFSDYCLRHFSTFCLPFFMRSDYG
jgi:hypothetical protein